VGYLGIFSVGKFISARKFLWVCIVFAVFSCVPGDNVNFTTTPQVVHDLNDIKRKGVLNALVDNNSVSYFIYRGQPVGYEYELLTRFADHLGVELKIKIISGVEEAIDMLNKGEGDVIAFPLTITQERQKYMAFSDAHFNTSQVLVQKKPDNWRNNPYEAE